ncbi:MAG: AraC family transcriptional regulator [Aquisalinus sp.]|nr:AraC family transcriptional regulator [Aquisalinus sp.]
MERLLRQTGLLNVFSLRALQSSAFAGIRKPDLASLIWWFFTFSVTCAMLPRLFGEPAGVMIYVVAIGGAAGCGWAWLLSRALFREHQPITRWNIAVLAAIIIVESWFHLSHHGSGVHAHRMVTNAASLVCISALMMVFVEALSGYSQRLTLKERRFRQVFCGVFGLMIFVALVWAAGADEMSLGARWVDASVLASVILCVAGSRLAVAFRRHNPLSDATDRKVPQAVTLAASDEALAARILAALERDQLFTTPDLKMADLAAAVGEQEYKVTSCITGQLGYRNFNQLINARRVDHAKQILISTEQAGRSILSVALDCGFNSIGPFNRAFKAQTGMTPSAFRANRRVV